MLNLKNATRAGRYWTHVLKMHAENTNTVDGESLMDAGRAVREDITAVLGSLRNDGVFAIENYWSLEKCAKACAEIDRLSRDYPQAVRRFSGDADHRMFGVEAQSAILREFHEDGFLRSIGELIGGLQLYNFATLGAKIEALKTNNGSGDGWHRDAFGYQFKSILYLSDVTLENGPFEYVLGSHRYWQVVRDTALSRVPVPPDSRINSQKLQDAIERKRLKSKKFVAKAGTVVLAITAGIHRGAPLRTGCRYALTNYYYHPYQVGQSLIDLFSPLVPGTIERLEPVIRSAQHKQ